MLPGVLPFQVTDNDAGGAGHVGRQLYAGHCGADYHLLGAANNCVSVFALEDPDGEIRGWMDVRIRYLSIEG